MTDRNKPRDRDPALQEDEVVLLKDLAPREDVKGGRKLRFGEPQPVKPLNTRRR